MLRPEPCSALMAPSYLSTTSSTRPVHEGPVALDRLGAAHVLGQHEVQVAVLGVAEDRRCRGRRGARRARWQSRIASARRATGTATSSVRNAVPLGRIAPVRAASPLRRCQSAARSASPVVKRSGSISRWPLQDRVDVVHRRGERRGVGAAQLDEQRRVPRLDLEGERMLRGDRAQRRRVEDLERVGPRQGERRHRAARVLEVGEQHERRRPRGRLRHGAQRDLGDEAERALGADHQVGQDLGRAVVVEEGVQAVAARVLGLELPPHAGPTSAASRRISSRSATSSACSAGRARRSSASASGWRVSTMAPSASITHQAVERVVAVLRDAAAHARGVVGQDAAEHRRVDRGRVGPDAPPVGREQPVEVAAHDAPARPRSGRRRRGRGPCGRRDRARRGRRR